MEEIEPEIKKEKIELTVSVDLIREDEYFIIATNDESEALLGQHICVQGKSYDEVVKEFWSLLKDINEYSEDRSRELDRWKPFQKGDWGRIGGTWFMVFGIQMYFRTGPGMLGGWYVPFTKLNISISNWRRHKKK